MRKISIIILSLSIALLGACSGTGGSKVDIKIAGKDMPLNIKSSGTYASTKTFTETKDGQSKITKASSNYIVLASYDLDTSAGMNSMNKPVKAADEIRVAFQLVGDEGTDDKSAIKAGSYTTKADKFGKVDYVTVAYFADGKESSNSFDIAKTGGEVKITSVSGDTVSGEIDLTEGERSIKGKFTAKLGAKK